MENLTPDEANALNELVEVIEDVEREDQARAARRDGLAAQGADEAREDQARAARRGGADD